MNSHAKPNRHETFCTRSLFLILSSLLFVGGEVTCAASSPAALPPAIQRIDIDHMDGFGSIRTSASGDLIVLGTSGKQLFVLVISPNGKLIDKTPLPAQVLPAGVDRWELVAMRDKAGNSYISHAGDRRLWIVSRDGSAKPLDLGMELSSFNLAELKDGQEIVVLGTGVDGVRVHLPDFVRKPFKLSKYPASGGLSDLHIGANGDLYAYSSSEQLIWQYAAGGQFIGKLGGGGPEPPHTTMPGEFTSAFFDVAPNGDIYCTAGDYGQIIKLDADRKQTLRYMGSTEWPGYGTAGNTWTPPFYQMHGLAISGDKAYTTGGNQMSVFPLAMFKPGTPGVSTGDARRFGLNYDIVSKKPYKLFTAPEVDLTAVFPKGNRSEHRIHFTYTVFDLWQKSVAQGSYVFDLPGSGEVSCPIPTIKLPLLGWYRVDTSIQLEDGETLAERTNLIARTFVDPAYPIPPKAVSGWNDLQTHKMIGMGLHRFALDSFHDLAAIAPIVSQAVHMGIPYFLQLTNKPDVTPANVRAILTTLPHLEQLEIMNEPDQQGLSPEDYINKYLAPCYEEAHRMRPDIKIMGPAKCGIELEWMDRFFKAGGGKYVDIVSVHSYERNNSMDSYHWNWKLAALKEMMASHGCADKPLYQTEHGFLGNYHNFILRPQWQAWSVFDEYIACDRAGISPDRFHYYYVNEGGFASFSAELVDEQREIYPAALLMRTRAHLLNDATYDSSLDLGEVGNWLIQANRYRGLQTDVLIFINTGACKPVDLLASLPADSHIYDCWGNPLPGPSGHLMVDMYPTYITVPHGASVQVKLPWTGRNIARQAKYEIDDSRAQATAGRLSNGRLEFDFEDEPDRIGMSATEGHLPLDLIARWATPQSIDHVILYGNLADNDFSTPLEYNLEARVNGSWQTLDEIRIPTEGKVLNLGSIVRISSYSNPWIFVHQFDAVTTDAIRIHFIKTTFGQYPSQMLHDDLMKTLHGRPKSPVLQLREFQVFSPTSN